ncbi:MAG: hypothetical protein JNL68_13195 [Burkholderiales bacterium]|nr:hypothetical protein [Burkholderiales bacterium]
MKFDLDQERCRVVTVSLLLSAKLQLEEHTVMHFVERRRGAFLRRLLHLRQARRNQHLEEIPNMSTNFIIKPSVLAIAAVFATALSSPPAVFAAPTDKELEHQMRQSDGGHPSESELKGVKQPKPSTPTPAAKKQEHEVEHGLRASDGENPSHDHDPVKKAGKAPTKEEEKRAHELEHQLRSSDGEYHPPTHKP